MRAVIQRVSRASVTVGGEVVGRIDKGLLVLLGVAEHDTQDDVIYLAAKIVGLRIFPDNEGKMNRSLLEVGGRMLVVSQFTLLGDCRKGRRPSFIEAARPEQAVELYRGFVAEVRGAGGRGRNGAFSGTYGRRAGERRSGDADSRHARNARGRQGLISSC